MSVNSVMFSPDSKLIVSGSWDNNVKIWDVATGTCTQTLEGHWNWVGSVAFSPNSELVASGSADNTVKIWDAATGLCTQTLEGHRHWIRSGVNALWCAATGLGHSGSVNSVAFSPDSRLVTSGSDDKTIKIWDVVTGACTQTLKGHSNAVRSVTFLPDSKLVASGSEDTTVKIWDAATGICTQTLKEYSGAVYSELIASWSGFNQDYGISGDNRWITKGSENWLWLPPGCRPGCSAIAASTIAIGCSSGRVLIMTFPTDS